MFPRLSLRVLFCQLTRIILSRLPADLPRCCGWDEPACRWAFRACPRARAGGYLKGGFKKFPPPFLSYRLYTSWVCDCTPRPSPPSPPTQGELTGVGFSVWKQRGRASQRLRDSASIGIREISGWISWGREHERDDFCNQRKDGLTNPPPPTPQIPRPPIPRPSQGWQGG
jgi:hypothetical protein